MPHRTPHYYPFTETYKSKVSSGDTTPDYLINKILQGTGITITHGNIGADETLIIATSGGSVSLTPETPSGTINGTNKIFTFVNNPVMVFLNGAIQQASGSDYTLSGTYTVTFVTAPPTGSTLFSYHF